MAGVMLQSSSLNWSRRKQIEAAFHLIRYQNQQHGSATKKNRCHRFVFNWFFVAVANEGKKRYLKCCREI